MFHFFLAILICALDMGRMEKELIEQIGGIALVADKLGQSRQAVHNWCRRGIPWRWRYTIAQMAKAKKVALPDGFLNPEEQ